jgi:hypothetical protein
MRWLEVFSLNFERSNTTPRKETIRKAERDRRACKSPSTQAGEFVREEMDEIRQGEHGARSPQQAIALGLSEARPCRRRSSPAEEREGQGAHAPQRQIRV